MSAVVLVALSVTGYFAFLSDDKPAVTSTRSAPPSPAVPKVKRTAGSLEDLLKMTPEQLGHVDIAEMNLLCATGLPGAEDLDVNVCLAMLDQWVAHVRHETDRHAYKFYKNPMEYNNSQAYFRMLMLVTVLQQDLGVHYNLDRVRDIDFTRSEDLFIHGMIGSHNGGTCVSMPALYTAVARRLRYPVKLVLAKAHVFCRWDGPRERLNVEGSSRGMHNYDDDYYKTWPKKITPADIEQGRFLRSLSPAEELARFLASRGHCLLDTGRRKEAAEAYAAAHRLAPKDPAYFAWMRQAEGRSLPPGLAGAGPGGPSQPRIVYRRDPLAELERINAINRANIRRTAEPPHPPLTVPRPGAAQPNRPPVPGQVPR